MIEAPQSNLNGMQLVRNAHGRLVLTLGNGLVYEAVVPVRAFPIAAPAEGLSLIAADGKEALWVARMADLQPEHRQLIEQDLAVREFVPTIERIPRSPAFPPPAPGICRRIAA
jgi:hypothetical protein